MPKKNEQRRYFAVCGDGPFPVDMLRYDRVTPAQEVDSRALEDVNHRVVWLTTEHVDKMFRPTRDRWESFGWHVVLILSKDAVSDHWREQADNRATCKNCGHSVERCCRRGECPGAKYHGEW